MVTRQDTLGGRLWRLRENADMSRREVGERIGVNQSTIQRWEENKIAPGWHHVSSLADLYDVSANDLLDDVVAGAPRLKKLPPRRAAQPAAEVDRTAPMRFVSIPVVGEVQAGAWRESIEWDADDQYPVAIPAPNHGSDGSMMRGYVVKGKSMNVLYPEGTIVFVIPTIANRLKPKSGDRVLVSRKNADGLYEATLKEYVVEGGRKWLWPRSTDPEFQSPIRYDKDSDEVTIVGVVRASFILEALR